MQKPKSIVKFFKFWVVFTLLSFVGNPVCVVYSSKTNEQIPFEQNLLNGKADVF